MRQTMMDRLAFADDTARNRQLEQWRANWGSTCDSARTQTSTPVLQIVDAATLATSALVASAIPVAFAPLPANSISSGAYAIPAATAAQAYRDDGRD